MPFDERGDFVGCKQGWIREPFCGLSHFVGVVVSVVGLVALLVLANGRPWHVVSFAIYGASLILLYTASTLYHSLPVPPHHVVRLRRFDYSAIFLLIAGTYVPLCLVPLRGPWGWSLLAAEYGMALFGIGAVLFRQGLPSGIRMLLYFCMGYLVVIALAPLRQTLPTVALAWLFGGGMAYTVGAIILGTNRPHLWPGKFSAHDLWHLFVLGGSACHFVVILCFVAKY
jgi:hemolysin III